MRPENRAHRLVLIYSATATAVVVVGITAIAEAAAEEQDYDKDDNPRSSAAAVVYNRKPMIVPPFAFLSHTMKSEEKCYNQITMPPLTEISCPVIYELPARKKTVSATSYVEPSLPSGTSCTSSRSLNRAFILVSIMPGETLFTRNSAWRQFFCQRLGKPDDRRLAHGIKRFARRASFAPHGSDIDDSARCALSA